MKRLIVCLLLSYLTGRGAQATPPPAVAPFGDNQAKAHQKAWADHLGVPVETSNSSGIKFVLIPPGEFMMGSPEREPGSSNDETEHRVKITKPFFLSVYEVTQQQYEQLMGNNPSGYKVANKPVDKVSWHDAVQFFHKLSEQEGMEYRLPTEAEWEYACRAGTVTAYSFGGDVPELTQYGWFSRNSKNTTHPVGKKLPNPWGLYDMHGNVWEWCQDWYAAYRSEKVLSDPQGPAQGKGRVLRGGAFHIQPLFLRSGLRGDNLPDIRNVTFGFRLARTCNLSP